VFVEGLATSSNLLRRIFLAGRVLKQQIQSLKAQGCQYTMYKCGCTKNNLLVVHFICHINSQLAYHWLKWLYQTKGLEHLIIYLYCKTAWLVRVLKAKLIVFRRGLILMCFQRQI